MTRLMVSAAFLLLALAAGDAAAQVRVVTDVDYRPEVEYADKKDRLDLYMPARSTKAPVVVSIHGGALRQGDKSEQSFVGRHLASAGYVTAVINYRLSPGVRHPAHADDAAAAVAWMKRHAGEHGGDPSRIFVIGHSAGAYLAALIALDSRFLTKHQLSPRDLTGVVPVSGFFYVDRTGVAPDRPKDVWGTEFRTWQEASPGRHVSRQAPPFLLVYTDGDDAWRQQQQRDFEADLRAAGVSDVSTTTIPGRTHLTVWSEMEGDEATSRAILAFVGRLAQPRSH